MNMKQAMLTDDVNVGGGVAVIVVVVVVSSSSLLLAIQIFKCK